jgi:hypothetical protein
MHYKYANLSTLGNLKAIIDGDPNTNQLLMDSVSSVDSGIYVDMFKNVQYGRDQIRNNAFSWAFSITRYASKLLLMCDKEVFVSM